MPDMGRSEVADLLRFAKHPEGAEVHPGTGTTQAVHGHGGGGGEGGGKKKPPLADTSRYVRTKGNTTTVNSRDVLEVALESDSPPQIILAGKRSYAAPLAAYRIGRPSLPEGEIWVRSDALPDLETKVKRLGRKSQKLGYDPLRLTPTGKTHVWIDSEGVFGMRDGAWEWKSFKVEGEPPNIPGFEFAAKLEHLMQEDGSTINLLKTSPHFKGDIPEKYRNAGPNCDYCKRNIYRRDTFIVRNTETGEWVQLGRDDLASYTGREGIEKDLYYAETFLEDYSEYDDLGDYDGEGGARGAVAWSKKAVIAAAVSSVRQYGYVKANEAGATKYDVLNHLTTRREEERLDITDADVKKAEEILIWAEDLEPGNSDYLWNLKVALTQPRITEGMIGIAASSPPAYERAMEKDVERAVERGEVKRVESDYVGTPKERLKDLKLTVTRVAGFEGNYGWTTIYNFRDDSGNSMVWFSSNDIQIPTGPGEIGPTADEWRPADEGDVILLDATVKAHKVDTFRNANERQTVLTRGKFKEHLGTVEIVGGMPAGLARSAKRSLTFPTEIKSYSGKWGRYGWDAPERKEGSDIRVEEMASSKYGTQYRIKFVKPDDSVGEVWLDAREVEFPDEVYKRAHVAEILKHGSHNQKTHGNWARGISNPQLASRTDEPGEGFTVQEDTGVTPTTGYVVATPGEDRISADQFGPDNVARFRKRRAADLAKPDHYLGAWYDTETNTIALDVSVVLDDMNAAMDYGRSSNQDAIWDLNTNQEIRLDGSTPIAARRVLLGLT